MAVHDAVMGGGAVRRAACGAVMGGGALRSIGRRRAVHAVRAVHDAVMGGGA